MLSKFIKLQSEMLRKHLGCVCTGRPLGFGHGLLLPQQQIDHPATSNMIATRTTMLQDVLVRTACVFEGISEDRHTVESTVAVDGGGKVGDGGGQPGGVD